MTYSGELIKNVEKVTNLLDMLIDNSHAQKATNLGIAYSLRLVLAELISTIQAGTAVNRAFVAKWNNIMGQCTKFFEDHPILDLLDSVDKEIVVG